MLAHSLSCALSTWCSPVLPKHMSQGYIPSKTASSCALTLQPKAFALASLAVQLTSSRLLGASSPATVIPNHPDFLDNFLPCMDMLQEIIS